MAKKFSLLVAAMALVAFAIPAFANADAITQPAKTLVPVGTTVVGVSTNVETTNTPVGTLKCKKVTIGAILTKNNGTEVAASDDEKAGANSAESCTAGGEPLTVDSPTLTSLTAGAKAGTTFVTLDFTATAGVTCSYTNVSATSVPFTYTAGTSTIHIAGKLKDPAHAFCLEPEIHGDFALTVGGAAVVLD
jgi:hypothetical protein